MSYDSFYGELSTRGTINDLLIQANNIKVSIEASKAEVAADTSNVDMKHAEVTLKAAQVKTDANLVSMKAQEVQANADYVEMAVANSSLVVIDDAAGLGDTNATWSADKSSKEFNGKVGKVAGKQLSDENYTTADKDKLSSIVDGETYLYILGEYSVGLVVSRPNQIIKDGDALYRASGSTTLPYTTTGVGMPEGGAFVSVGDAALRSDLSDFSGIVTAEGWPNVPSLADVELDVQSDALAKRTNRLKRSVLENGITRLLPSGGYSYVAHRGFSGFAPENTIPAFAAAARSGFKFVECDLINTGDGDFVIIHDNTLDRTTDSTGDVREMTVAQIKAATVDFGSNLIPAVLSNLPTLFPSLKVPTLEEFLKCCHKFGLHPIIEAKLYTPELRDQFFKRMMQILPLGSFSLLSSDITSLNHYRSMSDAVTLGWLASPTPSNINVCASLGNSFISFYGLDAALNAAAVRLAKEKGVLTNVWVVNNSRTAQDMIALQIDLISTDHLT